MVETVTREELGKGTDCAVRVQEKEQVVLPGFTQQHRPTYSADLISAIGPFRFNDVIMDNYRLS